jgi:hypothetical protein
MPLQKKRITTSGLAALLLAASAGAAGAQEAPPVVFKANALEVAIGGRVQTQFNTTSVEEEPATEWLMRRVRLEAKVKINDLVSGKVQPDFGGDRLSLKDAYVQLSFSPAFQVLAGKAHRPFSLLEQTSSTRILPIERGAEIRGITALDEYGLVNGLDYSDRDVGLQVLGAPEDAPLGFTYQAGVFEGPLGGGAAGGEDTWQVAARATVSPAEKLRIGGAWSSRHFARVRDVGDPEVKRGSAYEVDVEYGSFSRGLHLLGEVAFGDLDPFHGSDFRGAQGWLGYRTGPLSGSLAGLEPVLRLSWGSVDHDPAAAGYDVDQGGLLVTPGVTFWLGGLSRVMLNYDVWSPRADGADTERSFKAMFQVAF